MDDDAELYMDHIERGGRALGLAFTAALIAYLSTGMAQILSAGFSGFFFVRACCHFAVARNTNSSSDG